MNVTKVAKRYASALFLEAREQKLLDKVSDDMRFISDVISGSSELRTFLKSHIITRKRKTEVLDDLLDKNVGKLTKQFLHLIITKRREDQLLGISLAYLKRYENEQGIQNIDVYVVSKPDTSQSKKLQDALGKKTGKQVRITYIEDSSLKGGMAVRIDDTVIDGTIKHKLQQLEATFQQAGM